MKETLRHKEAFNYYYSLGNERKLSSVAIQFKVSERSVFKWSTEFNWQGRVQERDAKISDKLDKATEKEVFLTKQDWRELIRKTVDIYREKLKTKQIVINSPRDLETLAKLDLTMIGEPTDIFRYEEVDKNLEKLSPEELRKLANKNTGS